MDAYKVLAERHGYPDSERYRELLQFLMTPRQAELATCLPAPEAELAATTGMSVDQIRAEVNYLFKKGVVIPRNFVTLEGARFCRTAMQLHDATQANAMGEQMFGDRLPELWRLWEDFCQNEFYASVARGYAGRVSVEERVIPAYKAVEAIEGISVWDDVREILKAASVIAITPCSCRLQAQLKDTAVNTCVQFGRGAEYAITRGSGWKVDYTGALKAIEAAEDAGEVHMWLNWRTLESRIMCNCTRDACAVWTPLAKYGVPISKRTAKSRFEAVVDQQACTGCQDCVDRCSFDAIQMVRPVGSKKYKAVVDTDKCWGCGVCAVKCESKAIQLKLVRSLDHIPAGRQM